MADKFILASASPRRKELLQQIGLQFEVIPSGAEENILPDETPEELVVRLSRDKALEVANRPDTDGRWYLGSDTIVLCEDQILGKPVDKEDARGMLKMLSGRSHRVLSGFALFDHKQDRQICEAVSTQVQFRQLTDEEITRYIATGEPDDKAGAYAIQGLGVCFVAGIEGSYSNVVGLPLCRLTLALKELDVPLPI